MIVLCGALSFGSVLGWIIAYLTHHSRPGWREFKAALGVLLGAAVQSVFTGQVGLVLYGVGLIVGVALYGLTLIPAPWRRAHHFSPRR